MRLSCFKKRPVAISLEMLSKIWKDNPRSENKNPPEFNAAIINSFFAEYISPRFDTLQGKPLDVIKKLLALLDTKGDCPSVIEGDHETSEEYALLSSIPVRDHTVNVAKEAFHILNDGRKEVSIETPAVLIASLGHDTGKIPGVYKSKQSTLGHSYHSIQYIKPVLDDLDYGSKIITAIKLLHVQDKKILKQHKNSIFHVLKQADNQAREKELKCLPG